MSDATTKTQETIAAALHDIEPIMSKRTDLYGRVDVFAPNADPRQWPLLSFLLVSEHGIDGNPKGLYEYIKAKYVHAVFERPHFINDYMRFGHPDKDFF